MARYTTYIAHLGSIIPLDAELTLVLITHLIIIVNRSRSIAIPKKGKEVGTSNGFINQALHCGAFE